MVTRKRYGWVTFLVIVVVGVAAILVARSIVPPRDRPRAITTPTTGHPYQAPPPPGSIPPPSTDQPKPIYEGPIGDFLVGRNQGSSRLPCPRPLRPATNERIKASELYSPVFGDNLEGFVSECADGKIIVIEIYGPDIVGRGYFVGNPVLPWASPREGFRLLTAAGRPAIAQLPMTNFSWGYRLAVIERFPSGNQSGILVSIEDTDKNLEELVELAAQIMGVRR